MSQTSQVPSTTKRGLWGWIFFDWAAQPFHTLIVTFIFAPYFVDVFAPDGVTGQQLWARTMAIGGLIIAFTAPVLGALADANGPRKPWIAAFGIVSALGSWGLWYAVPGSDNVVFILTCVVFGLIGVEYMAVFNNAMMPSLAPREQLGRLSANASAIGLVGGLLALAFILGFCVLQPNGKTLFGFESPFGFTLSGREGERFVGPFNALWLIIFCLPLFWFTPDAPHKLRQKGAVSSALSELGQTLKSLPGQKSYFSFLFSSMLYRDGMAALFAFGAIYAKSILGLSTIEVGIFGVVAALVGAIGTWIGGFFDARFGPRKVVVSCVIILSLTCAVIVSTTPDEILFISLPEGSPIPKLAFYVAGAIIGAATGTLQASSRTLLIDQVSQDKVTEAFGLYALSGKATAFMAPALIDLFTGLSGSQRIGVLPVVFLLVISLIPLRYVKGYLGNRARS